MKASPHILVCRCAERRLLEKEALTAAQERDGVTVIPDLCERVGRRDPALAEWAASPSLTIYACHPRAVRALFQQAGAPLPEEVEIVNLRAEQAPDPVATPAADAFRWPPWFPVIDEDRCTRCGQCMEFCLFGVYAQDEAGAIRVVNPQQCKNNCPACARICPEAAIIFPKLHETPINGAEIDDETAVQANIRINMDRILGEDPYATLAERGRKRRQLLDRKKINQALGERARWTEQNS